MPCPRAVRDTKQMVSWVCWCIPEVTSSLLARTLAYGRGTHVGVFGSSWGTALLSAWVLLLLPLGLLPGVTWSWAVVKWVGGT